MNVLNVVLLQMFWLSFVLIGAAEILCLAKIKRLKKNKTFFWLDELHLLITVIVCLATGIASFMLVVLPAHIFELSLLIVKLTYLLALAASGAMLIGQRKQLKTWLSKIKPTRTGWLIFLAIASILSVDFIISIYVGGFLAGDAKFELAHITMFAEGKFGLTDPIFGAQGVPQTVYSVSVQHSLQALAMNLFNETAAWVWFYSHAFFRLIIWVSLFSATWSILNKKVRNSWSYTVLFLLPVVAGWYFQYPELHNKIVLAWTALFIVGLTIWLKQGHKFLLLVSAVLIASAHPLNAFITVCFLALLCLCLALLRYKKPKQILGLIPIGIVLLLPILVYYYYPHGITDAGFNDNPFSGPVVQIKRLGALVFNSKLPQIDIGLVAVFALLLAVLILFDRLGKNKVKIWILALVVIAILLVYNPTLISLLGFAYLFLLAKEKSIKLLIGLLAVFLPIIIYNPVILSVANDRVPLWTLSRFYDLNVLILIVPIIGMLAIITVPLRRWGYSQTAQFAPLIVAGLILLVLPFTYPYDATSFIRINARKNNYMLLHEYQAIYDLKMELQSKIVFTDIEELSAMIPGTVDTDVFSIASKANAHPSVHIDQRHQCLALLTKKLSEQDLQASGVNVVLTTSDSTFNRLARQHPNLRLMRTTKDFKVYEVEGFKNTVKTNSICNIPPPKYN